MKPRTTRQLKELPIDQIDPPARAMRESMDQDGLTRLVESIALLGVIEPIVVAPLENGRYEIRDGHRRYIACTVTEKKTIPAMILAPGEQNGEAIKLHANYIREDVNPAEEAVFLDRLCTEDCGGDIDKLCEHLYLRREYVEGRLLLLRGDERVLAAVREKRISLAVAKELNKVADLGLRRSFLESAEQGGATARLVINWRMQAEQVANPELIPASNGDNQFTGTPPPLPKMECFCCHGNDAPHEMEYLLVHRRCRGMFLDPFRDRIDAALRGYMPPGVEAPAPTNGEV
jgi:ParB/RepB/Spo0J family partition protein